MKDDGERQRGSKALSLATAASRPAPAADETQRSLRDDTPSTINHDVGVGGGVGGVGGDQFSDFFPPVRRPASRPLLKTPTPAPDVANLPIEGLFSTFRPPVTAAAAAAGGVATPLNNNKAGNSPIYTFKLNQGQSVNEVLTKLLADLTSGGSLAHLEVSHGAPLRVETPNDDDRLRPWSNLPFRPAIFNNFAPQVTFPLV